MTNFVKITDGVYRNQPIEGVFPLIKPTQQGKKGYFVTVDASALLGSERTSIRVVVPTLASVEPLEGEANVEVTASPEAKPQKKET